MSDVYMKAMQLHGRGSAAAARAAVPVPGPASC